MKKFILIQVVLLSIGGISLIVNFVFFFEPFAISKPQELMRDSKIFLAIFDSIISGFVSKVRRS